MDILKDVQNFAVKKAFQTAAAYLKANRQRVLDDKTLHTYLDVFNTGVKMNLDVLKTKMMDYFIDLCEKEGR